MSFNQNPQHTATWWSKMWAGGSERRVQQIQHIRDDGTMADEILSLTRDKLIKVSVLLSSALCAFFYYFLMADTYPIWMAIGVALVIAVMIEVGKVFFGIRAARYLYFHKPLSTIADTVLFLGILLFSALTFFWSVKTSTSGLHDFATRTSEAKALKSISFSPDVASIDKQIADARKSQENAQKMKWKGKVTVEGQRMSRRSEETISKLQDQRAAMIKQAEKRYDQETKVAGDNTRQSASWTSLVGGMIEAVQVLLIIIAASCERKLADRHYSGHNPYHSSPNGGRPQQNGHQYAPNHPANAYPSGNQVNFSNSAPSVRAAFTLSEQKPTGDRDTDSDFVELRLKRLKGWDDNFNNNNNKPETVAENMTRLLNEIGKKMLEQDFLPSQTTMQRLIDYCERTGFPAMEKAGFQYKYKAAFLDAAQKYTGARAAA